MMLIQSANRIVLLMMAGVVFAGACSAEGRLAQIFPDRPADGADEPDATDPDGDPDVVDPTTEPPIPRDDVVLVTFRPPRVVHRPGQRVTGVAELVVVSADDPETEPTFEWTVDPADAVNRVGDGVWLFEEEGFVSFTACTTVAEETVCGTSKVVVDNGPPSLEITSPEGGAFLSEEVVEITGHVSDTQQVPRVFIRGEELEVDEDGNFAGEYAPEFGVNHIEVTATDSVNEDEGRALVDVMWAETYLPPPDPEVVAFDLPGAIMMRMNRDFFDDGDPYVPRPEIVNVRTSDLAGLLELVLYETNLTSMLPDPIMDEEALFLRVLDVRILHPRVEITITEVGLEIYVQLADIIIETEGVVNFGETQLDLKGEIWITASVLATMRIRKEAPDAPYDVAIEAIEMTLENLESHFSSPEADAVFELAESALRNVVNDTLVGTLVDSFLPSIPATIADVLTSVDEALGIGTISFPLEPLPPIEFFFNGVVQSIIPNHNEWIDIVVGAEVGTPATPVHADAPGVPLHVPLETLPELRTIGHLQVAIDLALINGLLYALWNSGLLDIDVTNLEPSISALAETVTMSAKLPPVVTMSLDRSLILTIGQLELVLDSPEARDVFAFNFQAEGFLLVEDNVVTFSMPEEPSMEVWTVEQIGERPIPIDAESLGNVVRELVWPSLTALLAEDLVVPLPELDLSAIAEIAPDLSDLTTRLVLKDSLELRGNHMMIDAYLEGHVTLFE